MEIFPLMVQNYKGDRINYNFLLFEKRVCLMNKIILLFLFSFLFSSTTFSQEAPAEKKEEKTVEKKKEKKVEEISEEEKSPKNFNIRFDPILSLLGIVTGTIDIKMNKALSVGPTLQYFNLSVLTTTIKSFTYGVEANYATSGNMAEDSWILTAKATNGSYTFKQSLSGTPYESSINMLTFGAMAGYQYMWDSFNIHVAGGFSYYTIDDTVILKSASGVTKTIKTPFFTSGVGPSYKFTFGWAF
jgi:hypothetical protein